MSPVESGPIHDNDEDPMSSKRSIIRHQKIMIVLLLIVGIGIVLKTTDMGQNLTLSNVQAAAETLKNRVHAHYISSVLIFIAAYILINLWLPAAAVLTLLAGYLFNTIPATLYVLIAATSGALLAFWISRHIVGDWIQQKWNRQLINLNRQIERQGYLYLVFIRMIPLIPYSLINFLAGLTKIRSRTIIWTTALGSLPGILIFTYAGRQFLTIKSVDDVLTPGTIIAFSLLAAFAVIVILIKFIMGKKDNSGDVTKAV
jgi:uncharacterized membrane protein YdjX (TVP38/TMEM64 family)